MTIAHVHIAISMLKRHTVQSYFTQNQTSAERVARSFPQSFMAARRTLLVFCVFGLARNQAIANLRPKKDPAMVFSRLKNFQSFTAPIYTSNLFKYFVTSFTCTEIIAILRIGSHSNKNATILIHFAHWGREHYIKSSVLCSFHSFHRWSSLAPAPLSGKW